LLRSCPFGGMTHRLILRFRQIHPAISQEEIATVQVRPGEPVRAFVLLETTLTIAGLTYPRSMYQS